MADRQEPMHSPYNFVPLPDAVPRRRNIPGWHRTGDDTWSGVVVCKLTALEPLFTADQRTTGTSRTAPLRFLRNANKKPILQGTSLKGMVRAVYEAAFPSCLPLAAARGSSRRGGQPVIYELDLPASWRRCRDLERLCPACRLFGVTEGEEVHARGRLAFGDAILETPDRLVQGEQQLAELSAPKPHHYPIYSRSRAEGGQIAGRKFYYHHEPPREFEATRDAVDKGRARAILERAPKDAVFGFELRFDGLTDEELARLVACLALDADHAHKVGMARPLGFGSCRITLEETKVWRGARRYAAWSSKAEPAGGTLLSHAGALQTLLSNAPLERLLRVNPRREDVGYRSYHGYRGVGVDDDGRYESVRGREAGTAPEVKSPHGGLRAERKAFKPNDRVEVRVLRREGGSWVLRLQDGRELTYTGSAGWRPEQDRTVIVVAVDAEGGIIQVKPS